MVHTFSALGRNLAVDVNSGAVHVLDKLCCDLLSLVEGPMGDACPQDLKDRLSQYDARELDEAWTELLELQRAGLLFSDDDYIDPAAAMALPKAAVVKALCLHVSHDCNLRCRYCFASTGDFGTGHRMTMDFDTAKRAIDWVVEKSGKRRNIEVDFFGGEPLMALDTVKRTVEYARSLEEKHDKCFRFTITTNGVLLDQDTIDYINREMSNVVLSLDGRREVNDHMRPTVNGKGSYDVIVPKFQQLVSQRGTKDYYVRGTFTRENLDFALSKAEFGTDETLTAKAEEARKKFCTAMDDDLNTPDALAAMFDLVKEINTLSAVSTKQALTAAAAAFDEIAGVLGLLYNRKKDEIPAEVTALVEKRAAAKKAKDWPAADAIRAELAAMGWAVKDTAQGPQLSKL